MLAGIVILLNQKVYCVNVYARISLNRSFSDTIFPAYVGYEKECKYIDVCPLSLDPAVDPPSIPICTKVGRRR